MAGSVQKRGEDSWLLTVSCGIDDQGRRIRHTKTIKASSRREAEKILAKYMVEVESGQVAESGNMTFRGLVNLWLKEYAEKQLAPKTTARYKAMLDSRILPAMGHLKIDKIRPAHVMQFLNHLAESPRLDGKEGRLSDQTIRHHYRCISAIFQDAVEWQLMAYNPCSRVKPPKVQKKQATCYDEKQTAAMLKVLAKEDHKYQVLILLAISSGAREGEIMGLEWKHVDFTKGTIRIEQASQYLSGMGIFTKEPKNESSKRVIALPPTVMKMLKEHQLEQNKQRLKLGTKWQGSDRLFTTWDGRPGYPGWPGKWFHQFLEEKNLPSVPFHSLRHLNATLLIHEGVELKKVSHHLGHTDIGTTANIYAHVLQSAEQEMASTMENKLFKKNKKNSKKSGMQKQ